MLTLGLELTIELFNKNVLLITTVQSSVKVSLLSQSGVTCHVVLLQHHVLSGALLPLLNPFLPFLLLTVLLGIRVNYFFHSLK